MPLVEGHPAPPLNRDVAFLYDGFNHGELRIQHCDRCHRLRYPPSPFCTECQCPTWSARTTSGRGTLHSYTVHHHPPIPPWPLPHTVVLADMLEGFRFVAAMPRATPADLRVGQPLRLIYIEAGPGYHLPQFVVSEAP